METDDGEQGLQAAAAAVEEEAEQEPTYEERRAEALGGPDFGSGAWRFLESFEVCGQGFFELLLVVVERVWFPG